MVAEARVATEASAHQDSTGFCACEQLMDDALQRRRLGLDAGEGLDHRHVAERVGGLLGEARMVALDGALQGLGLAQHDRGQDREHEHEEHEQEAEAPVQEQR